MKLLPTCLVVLLVALSGDANSAPSSEKVPIVNTRTSLVVVRKESSGNITKLDWERCLTQQVVAEGIAQTEFKGLGQRVILAEACIYVSGSELPNGRLVRVTGVLNKHRFRAAPPNAQGFGETIDYYSIDDAKVDRIDAATQPYLVQINERMN